MYNKWDKYSYNEYDPKNPTFSSSLLDKINKSLKTNPKQEQEDDLSFFREAKNAKNRQEEKMSSLKRACLVEKWMEKKVSEKVMRKPKSSTKTSNTLLEEFDVQDTLFFSNTSTSSSSSTETDYSHLFGHSKHKRNPVFQEPCKGRPTLKSVKTRPIESRFLDHSEECNTNSSTNGNDTKSTWRAVKIYSNLKNLKQPISPGVRLSSFINSLFTKDNNKKSKSNNNNKNNTTNNNATAKSEKITSYSACTTPSSYSRSCLSNTKKKFQEDGSKRTVRFCPVSVIVDEDSRPCGHKSLFKEKNRDISSSNFARSLSKRYEELKMLNNLEKDSDKSYQVQQRYNKLEEVALDLLSGYWDSRLSKSHNQSHKDEVKNDDDDYGGNYGANYDQHQEDVDNDDGLSCSSSDLFELEHLSLIGDELPVYETTQFGPKFM